MSPEFLSSLFRASGTLTTLPEAVLRRVARSVYAGDRIYLSTIGQPTPSCLLGQACNEVTAIPEWEDLDRPDQTNFLEVVRLFSGGRMVGSTDVHQIVMTSQRRRGWKLSHRLSYPEKTSPFLVPWGALPWFGMARYNLIACSIVGSIESLWLLREEP